MNIQHQYFPKSCRTPDNLLQLVKIFCAKEDEITSSKNNLKSDDVLRIVSDDIAALGYQVERGKKDEEKIKIPVLFGLNGTLEKYFEADCYHPDTKVVVEIEAGRAVDNYQFLKDIFEACVMSDVDYLVIAVRNLYRRQKDFNTVITFLDTLYASNRLNLPLKGILVIGY